jgi:hypothetical protein
LINEASRVELSRLLNLYPVHALRVHWAFKGKKDEIIDQIIRQADWRKIKEFLDAYLTCCKQHVYLFSHENDPAELPRFRIPDAEKEHDVSEGTTRRVLYVAKLEYRVIFTDPLREETLTFLWPLRMDFTSKNLVIRFITMEKDLSTYVKEPSKTVSRSLTESKVLDHLQQSLNLTRLNINRGLKHLWDADRIDGLLAKFQKSESTQTETMHGTKGLKQTYPNLYREVKNAPLSSVVFKTLQKEGDKPTGVSSFSADASRGSLSFYTYTEQAGDTVSLVDEIIRHN